MKKNISIFSFFAGIGFLDLGFELNSFDVCFVNEYNNQFLNAYKFARKKMDIPSPKFGYHQVSAADFLNKELASELKTYVNSTRTEENIVGFIAGPPCPDFSVAGRNVGSMGKHGLLTGNYFQLILEQQPDFFLFENVKGLWKTAKHRLYYDELVTQMQEAGYATYDKLTNSLECGVAQDRDRVILLGFKKSVFGDDLSDFPWKNFFPNNKSAIKQLDWPKTNEFKEDAELVIPYGLPIESTCEYWFIKNDVLNHPNSRNYFKPQSLDRFTSIPEGHTKGKSFKRLHRWRYSPTCAYGNNEVHLHPYKPRRISVAEALAIQSLPKEFTLPAEMPLSFMFKAIGNGVPYKLADNIAKAIDKFIIDNKTTVVKLPFAADLQLENLTPIGMR